MEVEYYDVIIATPGNMMCYNYVQSLAETFAYLSTRNITYKYVNCQGSPVNLAREKVASEIAKYKYKKVIWIDSDIGFTPYDFMKLYDSDKDIISGAYLLANGNTSTVVLFPQNRKQGQVELLKNDILKMSNPVKAESVGFGFIAISYDVFNRIQKPYFQLLNSVLRIGNKEIYLTVGEDISWCNKARNIGFDIWFDPKVLVNHMKPNKLEWK